LRELLADFCSTWLSADGKLWRSLRQLLFHPGSLTVAYREGRRTRYLSPLRLYFFSSILLFLLLSLGGNHSSVVQVGGGNPGSEVEAPSPAPEGKGTAISDAVREAVPWQDTWLGGLALARLLEQASVLDRLEPEQVQQILTDRFFASLPIGLFLCLPMMALALRLAFLRRDYLYFDHFIYALHLQAFVFSLLILVRILRWLPMPTTLGTLLGISMVLWGFVYFLRSLKLVTGRSYVAGFFTGAWVGLVMLPTLLVMVALLFFGSLLGF